MTEIKNDQDVIDELPDEGAEDTDWKALAKKNQGIAKRLKTKLDKAKETKPKVKPAVKQPKSKDSDKLDYGQKAFLVANGIKGNEEHQLAVDMMKNSGKDLDEVIENKFFMSELKEMRDAKAINEATPPSDGDRPSSTPRDEAGFWVAKGEMPPNTPENQKLRQDVVNAKMKSQTDGNPFSSNPVVGGPK